MKYNEIKQNAEAGRGLAIGRLAGWSVEAAGTAGLVEQYTVMVGADAVQYRRWLPKDVKSAGDVKAPGWAVPAVLQAVVIVNPTAKLSKKGYLQHGCDSVEPLTA